MNANTELIRPRRALSFPLQLGILSVAFLFIFTGSVLALPPRAEVLAAHAKATQGQAQLVYLFGFSVLTALSLWYPIRRARAGGLKLAGGLLFSFYGLETFMGQIETAYFQYAFPLIDRAELVRLFLRGAIAAVLFVPFAVWLLRREDEPVAALRADIPWRAWAWRVPLLALAYVALYLLFGHFVAWQFADVRQFYTGSTQLNGFLPQMARLIRDEPGFIPFQYLRGLLWVLFSVPVVLLMRERRAAMTSLAMLLGLFGAQILLPSAFFPPTVRLAHFIETASSTALFGALVGWALTVGDQRKNFSASIGLPPFFER